MNDNNGNDRPEDDAILSAENEGMDEAIGHERAGVAPNAQINILADVRLLRWRRSATR
jgi:hypothetical protein